MFNLLDHLPSSSMPPGPAYNWFCVLYSAAEILSHAARYRAAQASSINTTAYANPRKRRRTKDPTAIPVDVVVVDDVSIVTRSAHDSLHDDATLPASESSASAVTTTATENLQPLQNPHEVSDVDPKNSETEAVLQQVVCGKFLWTLLPRHLHYSF